MQNTPSNPRKKQLSTSVAEDVDGVDAATYSNGMKAEK